MLAAMRRASSRVSRLRRRAASRLLLAVDVTERLPVGITDYDHARCSRGSDPSQRRYPGGVSYCSSSQFSKPVLDRPVGQDSVAELLAHTVRTGRSTAVATIAAGAAGSPLAAPVPPAAAAGVALLPAARDQPNIGACCSPRRRSGGFCYRPRPRRPRRRCRSVRQ
jgi:hypothetical protein